MTSCGVIVYKSTLNMFKTSFTNVTVVTLAQLIEAKPSVFCITLPFHCKPFYTLLSFLLQP